MNSGAINEDIGANNPILDFQLISIAKNKEIVMGGPHNSRMQINVTMSVLENMDMDDKLNDKKRRRNLSGVLTDPLTKVDGQIYGTFPDVYSNHFLSAGSGSQSCHKQ